MSYATPPNVTYYIQEDLARIATPVLPPELKGIGQTERELTKNGFPELNLFSLLYAVARNNENLHLVLPLAAFTEVTGKIIENPRSEIQLLTQEVFQTGNFATKHLRGHFPQNIRRQFSYATAEVNNQNSIAQENYNLVMATKVFAYRLFRHALSPSQRNIEVVPYLETKTDDGDISVLSALDRIIEINKSLDLQIRTAKNALYENCDPDWIKYIDMEASKEMEEFFNKIKPNFNDNQIIKFLQNKSHNKKCAVISTDGGLNFRAVKNSAFAATSFGQVMDILWPEIQSIFDLRYQDRTINSFRDLISIYKIEGVNAVNKSMDYQNIMGIRDKNDINFYTGILKTKLNQNIYEVKKPNSPNL